MRNNMTNSDYIASLSIIISALAFAYSYFSNTKKYELTSQYRKEILSWFSDTISTLVQLKIEASDGFCDKNLKKILLSRLSTQIELGRFYFPNIDKGDKFGENKPLAYKGYRNLTLDFLVFSYQLFERKEAKEYIKHAEILQRHFTSSLFDVLDPKEFLKQTEKHTNKTFSKELSFEDFIKNDPDALENYL